MAKAGGRARIEYERRRARDRARARARRAYVIGILVLVGPLTYGVSRAILPGLFRDVLKSQSFTAKQAHEFSLLLAVIAFLSLATEAIRRRPTTEAFRIGAEGEERIGSVLDRISSRGYTLMHDVPLRGYGNIDHIAVGPGGVFTIETKNAAGRVTIRRGQLRVNGRRRPEHIAQAQRQTEAVHERLRSDPSLGDIRATPLLCFARARIDVGWFGSNVLEGVHVVDSRGLILAFERSDATLTAEDIERASAALSAKRGAAAIQSRSSQFAIRAPMPTCSCGSPMVLRRRKSDGAPFYGCSQYPICRRTKAPLKSCRE